MNNDLFMVLGIVIGALAVPSIISAFSESRTPRAAAVLLMIAGALIAVAVTQRPGGYSFDEIPDVFVRVFAQFIK
jgi:hypothetical protein